LYQNDSIYLKYDVWLRFNGPNPSNCSPLISALDTINPPNITIDFLYDITGGSNPNGCLKTDSFRILRQLQPGNYNIICFWSIIDSLAPPSSYSPRYASDTVQITVLNSTSIAKIDFFPLSISPNPVQNKLTINTDTKLDIISTEIWDLNGRLVLKFGSNNNAIDVSNLTEGIYLLKTHTNHGVKLLKFMKI
jgi:hypothetical protein